MKALARRSTHLLIAFIAFIPLAGAAGCTHQIRPMPAIEAVPGEPLPLSVRYYIAPVTKAYVYSNSYFALGAAHTWHIEIGETLAATLPDALRSAFASVAPAAGPDDIGDADLLLVPAITHFEISSGAFKASIKVRVQVRNGSTIALDEVFEGTPQEGMAGTAWAAGYFGADHALQRSAELAFEDVMPKIIARLRKTLAKPPAPPA